MAQQQQKGASIQLGLGWAVAIGKSGNSSPGKCGAKGENGFASWRQRQRQCDADSSPPSPTSITFYSFAERKSSSAVAA
jgi:hypothetical protein